MDARDYIHQLDQEIEEAEKAHAFLLPYLMPEEQQKNSSKSKRIKENPTELEKGENDEVSGFDYSQSESHRAAAEAVGNYEDERISDKTSDDEFEPEDTEDLFPEWKPPQPEDSPSVSEPPEDFKEEEFIESPRQDREQFSDRPDSFEYEHFDRDRGY